MTKKTKMKPKNKIYIVLPCYNEELVVGASARILLDYVATLPYDIRLLFVDDGSSDSTWECLKVLHSLHPEVRALRLSHNCGQQVATLAGIKACVDEAAAVISMDVDLQDDIQVIGRMARDFCAGADVVYGVRRSREKDHWQKRVTASLFYRLMKAMGCELVEEHSEFRLLSQRAAHALLSFPERNLFVRCLVPLMGFESKMEYYDRQSRLAGDTKYSTSKLVELAVDGITNFSVRPIRWIMALGLACVLVAVPVIVWALVNWHLGTVSLGWPSLLISLWLLGGAQILATGVVGEYVAKIYTEVKRRPRYFVRDELK